MNNFLARKMHHRWILRRMFDASLLAILSLTLFGFNSFAIDTPATSAVSAKGKHHKIKVNNPVLAQQIAAKGGRLLADYGNYQIYDAPEAAAVLSTNSDVEIHDEYNVVMLNAKHLDTTRPEIKAQRTTLSAFSGKRLHLIHFVGPIQPQWRDDLIAAGVTIVSYIPENAYLVYGDSASLAKVQKLAETAPHVQWEGAYTSDYKIHPRARMKDEKGRSREIGTDLFAIQLMADDAANTNTMQLLDKLKLEPLQQAHTVLHYVNIVARLNAKDLATIAAQPEVVSIQPYFSQKPLDERQDQIVAGNLSNNIPSGPGYLAWLASKGFTQAQFTASGFSVDVSDTGVDEGTTSPAHFGLHVGGTMAGASREVYARQETTANQFFNTLVGCDGHGTINAHIIAGYDNLSGYPFQDANGYHYGLGVCPFVNIGSSVIFDTDYPETDTNYQNFPNFNTLQSQAHHGGARISNNSWGAVVGGLYDSRAQNYDALVRDAESTNSLYSTPGNQEMVIVFAAGNSGGDGVESIDTPATAKNVISVGAADNFQPFGNGATDLGGIGDSESSSANEIASFSSRGPCQDGRTKPDIMAPGTHVSGGVAQWSLAIPQPAGTGTCDPCFNGSGVDGGPNGNPFFPTNQQFYTVSSGTSHAAPCVAGGAALLRQYFINQSNTPPSAAMTKAFLMNSARYMTGSTANDTLPSINQGMGEMNLGTAFDGTPRILRDELSADMFTASGQSRSYVGTIVDQTKPFRVTVAWTDAPGNTTGAAYNNNLDLTVTVGGNVYKGNVFNGQYSATGGVSDTRNNVESVFLPAGVGGGFVVKINGTSINSVGVPNSSNALSQDFALVVYNANSVPSPIISAAGTTVVAESCSPGNGAIDPGETVTVNFSLQDIGSISTGNLTATLLTNSSIFPSGTQSASFGALAAGGAAASQPFTFTANGACGSNITATLQLSDGSISLGTVNFILPLGQFVPADTYGESFDEVGAPGLPMDFTNQATAGMSNWVTVTDQVDTAPNAAFVADVNTNGTSDLISGYAQIVSSSAQIVFRNNYDLENSPSDFFQAYDGGVLEISINEGPFFDIIAAGGNFVSGGYNCEISTNYSNPLGARLCWSGNSGGYITTTATLPPSAAGQKVFFRWRLATDIGNSTVVKGWYIDSIVIHDGSYVCCGTSTDVGISVSNDLPNMAIVGSNLVYTATIQNLGPDAAAGITFSDTLPTNVTFVSASIPMVTNGNTISGSVSNLLAGMSNTVTVTVVPTSPGPITNFVSVSSATPDFDNANNSAMNVSGANQMPFITTQPTNIIGLVGTNVMFLVSAGGTSPFAYQWVFESNNIAGANSNILTLTNIQNPQEGNYWVVVSNIAGSATSSVAVLTVLTPPKIYTMFTNSSTTPGAITGMGMANNANLVLFVNSLPGYNYTLQYKNLLTDSNWIPVLPSVPGSGKVLMIGDTNAVPAHRYYRVKSTKIN
ncbi:MAG TPA: S8 family serine peptidase [Verrucomicrobiae bacterium]|jgi:uncharacterized repeat protein (TIGR01451 family)|nr:S8 family serine peptidase [Verrucomicrobiae bacterium]